VRAWRDAQDTHKLREELDVLRKNFAQGVSPLVLRRHDEEINFSFQVDAGKQRV
jgi:hypothetical protein